MKAYIYQAAFLCETCAHLQRAKILHAMPDFSAHVPEDSDKYPIGPYSNGGGEADTPQHCDHCGLFLENPLTDDGRTYVREAALEFETEGADESWEEIAVKADAKQSPTLAQWIRFYFADGQ